MSSSAATRAAQLFLVLGFAYLAWHVWLAAVLHQTPDQWIAGVRAGLGL
ncbi:MAG: hypothetical protein KF809_15020 [Chloroflexi bacterium]|nr:hypothetical protein [Chloroflexota bacterium]